MNIMPKYISIEIQDKDRNIIINRLYNIQDGNAPDLQEEIQSMIDSIINPNAIKDTDDDSADI